MQYPGDMRVQYEHQVPTPRNRLLALGAMSSSLLPVGIYRDTPISDALCQCLRHLSAPSIRHLRRLLLGILGTL